MCAQLFDFIEIHHQITAVLAEGVMDDSSVRWRCRMFNERRENVHDEGRSGRPLLATEELKEQITNVIGENRYWGTQYGVVPSLHHHF